MSPKTTARVSLSLWALTVVSMAAAMALLLLNRSIVRSGILTTYLIVVVITVGYASAGALIVSRVRSNPIGWILLGIGLALALEALSEQYLLRALVAAPGSLPATGLVTWLNNCLLDLVILPIPAVFLLFPTGRPASRRWGWVLRASIIAGAVAVLATILYPGEVDGMTNSLKDNGLRLVNPTGIQSTKALASGVLGLAGGVSLAVALLAILSIVLRFRRAEGEEREQIKWPAFVGLGTVVLFLLMISSSPVLGQDSWLGTLLWVVTFAFALLGIPASFAIAMLKYRLYDIDVVINKTLVYGALAGFITAVYVGIVVGLGAVIGAGTSKPNLGLSILATAVVAVAFQPVRDRIQRLANRLVYGKRATPYEVLSEFSHRMGGSYATEDVLPRMARILAEGTGATGTAVWLRVGDTLRAVAKWPDADDEGRSIPLDGNEPSAVAESSATYPIRHRGELLGALSLTKAPGDRLKPAEEHLARDLAAGAGLVLRNVRLTQELLLRLDELQASRQRIVAAADEARRKLERNIHDGAQQQLVALSVKARLAERMMATDPAKGEEFLAQIEAELGDALQDLRDLARGVYPPLLADEGLAAAVRAQARKSALPVDLEAEGVGRYPQEVEAAAYFCILEALQNVAKYAGASRVVVRLSAQDGALAFTVTDDGAGFDPKAKGYGTGMDGMADRLSAQGGELRIDSAPGAGTIVSGRIPAPVLEAV